MSRDTEGSILPGGKAVQSERDSGEKSRAWQVRISAAVRERLLVAVRRESRCTDKCPSDGSASRGDSNQSMGITVRRWL